VLRSDRRGSRGVAHAHRRFQGARERVQDRRDA
jgi:hypothetical protein